MIKTTQSDASRIQSSHAKSGADMSSAGFASRAQAAGDRNANAATSAGQGTQASAGGQAGTGGGSTGGGKIGLRFTGFTIRDPEASQKK